MALAQGLIARALLVLVAVLQMIWLGESVLWTVLTMAAGAFALGWLWPEECYYCNSAEEDHADQGECPGGAE